MSESRFNAMTIVTVVCVLLLPVIGYQWGRTSARSDLAVQLVQKERQSTVLRDSLDVALADVRHDTVRVDSLVTRWRTVARTVTDTVRDTLTDTLTIERVVHVASATIDTLDTARRQCLSVLSTCERALNAADERARIALVLYETEKAQRSKRRTVERVVWATTLGSVAVWGLRK